MGLAEVGASVTTGLRPFSSIRDLPAVTLLLAREFSSELQVESATMARLLNWVNRLPVLAWAWPGLDAWFDGGMAGFVWVENGRVVGNANVTPLSRGGLDWVVSNVVVDGPFRRRGIGRRLVEACLEHVLLQGGRRALLQVWEGNLPAVQLYGGLGFRVAGRTRRLVVRGGGERATGVPDECPPGWQWRHSWFGDDWALRDMAEAMCSREARLLRPSPARMFTPSPWDRALPLLSRVGAVLRGERAVLDDGERARGALAISGGWGRWHRLIVVLSPDVERAAARCLAARARAMASSAREGWVVCDLPEPFALLREELVATGFTERDCLLQMVLDLGSGRL